MAAIQDNAGLTLPPGFCASVFADNLGRARHLAVAPSGDVYVNTWSSTYTQLKNAAGGYLVALRDTDRDGKADQVERFGPVHQDGKAGGGTGIAVHRGALYVEDNGKIVRYRLASGALVPQGNPEVILSGLWTERGHIMHPFAITSDGVLYVNSGSITNSCQEKDRTLESPGLSPCPELQLHAGIWRYDAGKTGQTFSAAERYATGTRNVVALAVNAARTLYATLHGRDNWPPTGRSSTPSSRTTSCPRKCSRGSIAATTSAGRTATSTAASASTCSRPNTVATAGRPRARARRRKQPALTFPAHWAPNGMTFYSGSTFPAKYRGGAFVAFHGSHDRKPKQAGYLVAFVPFEAARPAGRYEEFATGFSGAAPRRLRRKRLTAPWASR